MYEQIEKPKANKSRAVANSIGQKKSGGQSIFQFSDNRTEIFMAPQEPPIQRALWNKKEKRPFTEEEIKKIEDDAVLHYGEANRESIHNELIRLNAVPRRSSSGEYGIDAIRRHINALRLRPSFPPHVVEGLTSRDEPSRPLGDKAPETTREGNRRSERERKREALRQWCFGTVTQLTALIYDDETGQVIQVDTDSHSDSELGGKNSNHAEKNLIAYLNTLPKGFTFSQITITINNSPCVDCTPDLINWKSANPGTKLVINFTMPFDPDNFKEYFDALTAAGIIIRPSNPLHVSDIASDTDDELGSSDDEEAVRGKARAHNDRALGLIRKSKKIEKKEKGIKRNRLSDSDEQTSEPSNEAKEGVGKRSSSRSRRMETPARLHNVSGEGMNCLIRAVLYGAVGNIDETTVGLIRGHLMAQNVANDDNMLNLAGVAGAIMITYMVSQNILDGTRGIVVHTPTGRHDILGGVNPIRLWLNGAHFQVIE
jgi:hypothetical protein